MKFGEHSPYMIERIVVSLSYLTMGLIGSIWIILGAFTKSQSSTFVKYHVFQSIFISILLFLINVFLGIVNDVLSIIPFVKILTQQIFYLFNMPVFMNYSVIQITIYLFVAYLMLTSALGIYTYVPFVSDIISQSTGRGR